MTDRTLAGILLTAALAVSAGGCSSETAETTSTGPTGNPKLFLVSVNGVTVGDAGTLDGLCIEVPNEPKPTFPIVVGTANTIDLRPPGYCAVLEEVQCGHLVVRVNGDENSRSATSVALVHLGKLANLYADLTITIEVVTDDGKPILSHADAGAPQTPLTTTVQVRTSQSCPSGGGPSDAGAEGG